MDRLSGISRLLWHELASGARATSAWARIPNHQHRSAPFAGAAITTHPRSVDLLPLQGLHEGPYLAGLRQLKHFTIGGPPQGAAAWCLPAFLSAATSLQLLDLGRDSSLWVLGAEDAALLRTLPRLRRVLLPVNAGGGEEAAAAVAREGLRAGAGADAGSLHAVEVEGVVLR